MTSVLLSLAAAWILQPDPGGVAARFDFAKTLYDTPHGAFVLEHDRDFLSQASPSEREQLAELTGGRRVVAYRLGETGGLLLSDGEVLFCAARWAKHDDLARAASSFGAYQFTIRDRRRRLMSARGDAGDALRLAAALASREDVEWAHPDFIYRIRTHFVPDDEFYPQQWHHGVILGEGAWERERGSEGVRIAVIDTGVDMEHPDLAGKLVAPRDTENQDDDPSPEEEEAHGTACAGLAAAVTDNDLGVAGVCHNCEIIPIRLFAGSGFTRQGADSDAFAWAVDNGAAVISNSWGPSDPIPVPFSLEVAIQEAAINGRNGLGSVILFAAGNQNRENADFELASHPLVLSVGATTDDDQRANYSNFGASLDLMAPAATVTTDNSGGPNSGYAAGDYTSGFGGTSAATAVAAGIVGMVVSADPGLSRGQLTSVVLESADRIGTHPYRDGRNDFYGFGRVNALRALELVLDGQVCQPAAEVCDNGIDDDCDLAVDDADPNCAPVAGERCAGAGAVCAAGSVCLPGSEDNSYRCYETCDTECSAGECTPISNELSVCTVDDTVACPLCGDTIACDAESLCITFETFALSLCTEECESAADCPLGFFCAQPFGSTRRACAPLSFSCSAFGPGPGSPCDGDSCALGNICLGDGRCYAVCDSAADCDAGEDCTVAGGGTVGYCECACDLSAACETGCACDRDCPLACQCDESDACDPGCPCDSDCEARCTCDIVPNSCDIGCACDPECTSESSNPSGGSDLDPGSRPNSGSGTSSSSGCTGVFPWCILVLLRRRVGR